MIDTTRTFLGLTQIFPRCFKDKRGAFFESFNEERYKEVLPYKFVQNNISISQAGVLRGLHIQTGNFVQGKLITVLQGEIYDVAVDANIFSPFYGHHESITLSQGMSLFIPRGFLHGFYSIKDSIIEYKCNNYYNKDSEVTIFYGDKDLNIKWPIKNIKDIIISPKDFRGIRFKDLN